jgi:hypothetical protein
MRRRDHHLGPLAITIAGLLCLPGVVAAQAPTDASPSPSASAPTPAADAPLVLERRAVTEEDDVRLTLTITHNPIVAGEPVWTTTKVENLGTTDVIWLTGCSKPTPFVEGTLDDAQWREGQPVGAARATSFLWQTKHSRIDWGPTIRLRFIPRYALGDRGRACSDMQHATRISPGAKRTTRLRWGGYADGYALRSLGLPPAGRATITATFEYWLRPGEPDRRARSLEASIEAFIVNGRDGDLLHPLEVVDAALADPSFAAMIGEIDVGDGYTPILWFDPAMDLWEVGVMRNRTERLTVGLVDPRSGEVQAIVERPWVEGEDPYPLWD